MFICSLCGVSQDDRDRGSAASKVCRSCTSLMVLYRRYQDMTKHTERQRQVMRKVDRMVEHNKKIGGYVPKWYRRQPEKKVCVACAEVFYSGTNVQCETCLRVESNYRTMRRRGKVTPTITKTEALYHRRFHLGRHVPKVFIEKGPLS